MCTPAMALGAAGGLLNYGQQQAAHKQSLSVAKQQASAAGEAYRRDVAQLGLQEQQRQAQASRQMTQEAREKARAAASAITASGESGRVGLSLDALLSDYDRQAMRNREAIRYDQDIQSEQTALQKEKLQATAQSRANVAFSQVRPGGNLGLSIARGVVGSM